MNFLSWILSLFISSKDPSACFLLNLLFRTQESICPGHSNLSTWASEDYLLFILPCYRVRTKDYSCNRCLINTAGSHSERIAYTLTPGSGIYLNSGPWNTWITRVPKSVCAGVCTGAFTLGMRAEETKTASVLEKKRPRYPYCTLLTSILWLQYILPLGRNQCS